MFRVVHGSSNGHDESTEHEERSDRPVTSKTVAKQSTNFHFSRNRIRCMPGDFNRELEHVSNVSKQQILNSDQKQKVVLLCARNFENWRELTPFLSFKDLNGDKN